ncbi:hypothetical protein [Ketogulonicigenium vulgare]|uniref:hypothetical protein n=1 Tax=Ketogulonicigenium vulgare TaxID=92945 RepID=UPI0023591EDE|nr:hypothetical protein [Ketogulonicigenium vulgare]
MDMDNDSFLRAEYVLALKVEVQGLAQALKATKDPDTRKEIKKLHDRIFKKMNKNALLISQNAKSPADWQGFE